MARLTLRQQNRLAIGFAVIMTTILVALSGLWLHGFLEDIRLEGVGNKDASREEANQILDRRPLQPEAWDGFETTLDQVRAALTRTWGAADWNPSPEDNHAWIQCYEFDPKYHLNATDAVPDPWITTLDRQPSWDATRPGLAAAAEATGFRLVSSHADEISIFADFVNAEGSGLELDVIRGHAVLSITSVCHRKGDVAPTPTRAPDASDRVSKSIANQPAERGASPGRCRPEGPLPPMSTPAHGPQTA